MDAADSPQQTSHHLRTLSLDPLLHQLRLRCAQDRVHYLLPRRPPLRVLQPPISNIYLNRTHVAARKLHWSMICIRLSRSLSRRPPLKTLVGAGILPSECCKCDRRSGEFVWGNGVSGALVERKRRLEREQIKEGLRVWLERKASEIRARKKDCTVSVLVWRFSRKVKLNDAHGADSRWPTKPTKDRVNGLKRFFEDMANYAAT